MALLQDIDLEENGLDIDSVLASLPVRIVTRPDAPHGNGTHPDAEHFDFPSILEAGQREWLTIIAGYQIGDNPAMSDLPITLQVSLDGGQLDGGQLVEILETIPSQRDIVVNSDGNLTVVPGPQFPNQQGTAQLSEQVQLADNSDKIEIQVEAVLLRSIRKPFSLTVHGKLFMAPLQGPTEMAVGSTRTIRIPLWPSHVCSPPRLPALPVSRRYRSHRAVWR